MGVLEEFRDLGLLAAASQRQGAATGGRPNGSRPGDLGVGGGEGRRAGEGCRRDDAVDIPGVMLSPPSVA
jgi:hypothetical protein